MLEDPGPIDQTTVRGQYFKTNKTPSPSVKNEAVITSNNRASREVCTLESALGL